MMNLSAINPYAQVIPEWLVPRHETSTEPSWCTSSRDAHWQAFLQHGLPNRTHERWKYTDLSLLAKQQFSPALKIESNALQALIAKYRLSEPTVLLVMINGYFSHLFSDLELLPQTVIACSIAEALVKHEQLIKQYWPKQVNAEDYPFANLNAALFNDGLFLYLPDHCELTVPIHILSLAIQEQSFIAHTQNIFILGKNTQCVMLEEHKTLNAPSYMTNIATHFLVEENAKLKYYKIHAENPQAIHLAHTFIHQEAMSQVSMVDFSCGAKFVRDEVQVKLAASNAECQLSGLYRLVEDNQYVDRHIDINHQAPRTNSEMLYKGILEKKSRAVFNGRLHVAPDAKKIIAYQANHNLLLSNHAEIYSKPELEIYADEVKCKHGATTFQLDENALFYLRARGITENEAMNMLLVGFAEEVIARIDHDEIKKRAREVYENKSL